VIHAPSQGHAGGRAQEGREWPADRQPRARPSAAAGGRGLSQAAEGGEHGQHEPGRAAGVLARLPAPERDGPVAVGYASHFGRGGFEAEGSEIR